MTPILIAALTCSVLAIIAGTIAFKLRRRTGLPGSARVISSDVGQGEARLLRDPAHGLIGKPDYWLAPDGSGSIDGSPLIPVEVKPMRRAKALYESDEMELATYLMLVRATAPSRFAGYGWVRYADQSFRVDLTPERERRVLAYAALVREARTRRDIARNHRIPGRCRGCAVRPQCGDALV